MGIFASAQIGLVVVFVGLGVTMDGAPAHAQQADWSGWYVGAAIGSATGTVDELERDFPGGTPNARYGYTGDGVTLEFYAGRNWQSESWLYGIEIGARTGGEFAADLNAINAADSQFFYDTGLTFSVEGRVGYLVAPRTNLFASAGLALGYMSYDWSFMGATDSGRSFAPGVTAGLGVEHRFNPDGAMRVGLEYTSRETDEFRTPILPGFSYSNTFEEVVFSIGYTHFFGN